VNSSAIYTAAADHLLFSQKGGWAWIFIVEGLLTFVCAIPGFWLIQDFPARAKLFKGNERLKWEHHLHSTCILFQKPQSDKGLINGVTTASQGVTSAELPFSWPQVVVSTVRLFSSLWLMAFGRCRKDSQTGEPMSTPSCTSASPWWVTFSHL
jgi:hypothetical protein